MRTDVADTVQVTMEEKGGRSKQKTEDKTMSCKDQVALNIAMDVLNENRDTNKGEDSNPKILIPMKRHEYI